jgi:hypothetical protein
MRIVSAPGAESWRWATPAVGGTASTLARNSSGTATVSDLFSYETSTALVQKYVTHRLPLNTLRTDVALQGAGEAMANAIMAALDGEGFSGMEGLFNLAHPRAGAAAGLVGAGKKYIDDGLSYLFGEGGAGTQSNKLTGDLDEAGLNSAIQILLQYRSDRGRPLGIGKNGGLVLCCHPKNAKTAHELVQSQLSGQDNASNFVKGIVSDVCVYPFLVDDDDWWLIDKANAPVALVIGEMPSVSVNPDPDGLHVIITGSYTAGFATCAYEAGIVGSNKA